MGLYMFLCVLSCKSSWNGQFVTCFISKAQRLTRIDEMKGYVCMYVYTLYVCMYVCMYAVLLGAS